MKKISVIIPFYNAEKYIERCICSLNKQTFQDYEAIFINDGSVDNSLKILNKYKNKSIKIFSINKSGVSIARNFGIKKSTGKYICFMDIDDKYEDDYLNKMYNSITLNNLNIAICNYIEKYPDKEIIRDLKTTKTILNKTDINNYLIPIIIGKLKINDETTMASVWRIIVSKELLEKCNISFDDNLSYSEDVFFILDLLCNVNKIAIVKSCHYYYHKNYGSALNKYVENYINLNLYIHKKYQEYIHKYKLESFVKLRYLKNQFRMYTVIISNAVRANNSTNSKLEIIEITKLFNANYIHLKNIIKYLNWYELICFILMRNRAYNLLYHIFHIKEKHRLNKLSK